MAMKVDRVDTWAATLEDIPGSLAGKLEALARGGVNLEFIVARRAAERPGSGVVFVAPIEGAAGRRAAKEAGFEKTPSLHTVRIEGPDKPGRGAAFLRVLADASLNLRGVSGAVIGNKMVGYVALDTQDDATKAARLLRSM